MSFKDRFDITDESFEESGSLIHIYKCKTCGDLIPKYSMSMHDYCHRENIIPEAEKCD